MLTEKTFDAAAVSINYVEGPKSGPPLVLLHGVTSRWQRFLTLLPVLAQRWHVVAADLRGHGRSGRVPGRYGVMEYAQDVIGLIQHLGDEPAVVLGHSLGAMVGIGVAAEAPSAVRALILEDPPLGAFRGRPFSERPEAAPFVATRDLAREGHAPDELMRRLAIQTPDQMPWRYGYGPGRSVRSILTCSRSSSRIAPSTGTTSKIGCGGSPARRCCCKGIHRWAERCLMLKRPGLRRCSATSRWSPCQRPATRFTPGPAWSPCGLSRS